MPVQVGSTPFDRETVGEGSSPGQVIEGSFEGERVRVREDAGSLIADAAEELTFGASEVVEKKIAARKVGKEKRVDRAALAELYVQKAPNVKKDELLKFSEHVRKNRPDTVERMLSEAKAFFEDITDQYLALSFVKDLFEQEGEDQKLQATLQASAQHLMATRGPEIRAGLNVTEVALEFSEEGLGTAQHLRDFYRDTVLKYEGIKETFDCITRNFGINDFTGAVHYLIRAVGNDLHSKGPSVSPPELKRLLDDLYHLESLGNLYRDCADLIDKTNHEFQVSVTVSPHDLLNKILALKEEKWLTETQVLKLIEDAGIGDLEAKIYFLRGLKELLRLMPLKLFADDESRMNLVAKMQQALDTLIEQEQ
jgi:type III secretion protein W